MTQWPLQKLRFRTGSCWSGSWREVFITTCNDLLNGQDTAKVLKYRTVRHDKKRRMMHICIHLLSFARVRIVFSHTLDWHPIIHQLGWCSAQCVHDYFTPYGTADSWNYLALSGLPVKEHIDPPCVLLITPSQNAFAEDVWCNIMQCLDIRHEFRDAHDLCIRESGHHNKMKQSQHVPTRSNQWTDAFLAMASAQEEMLAAITAKVLPIAAAACTEVHRKKVWSPEIWHLLESSIFSVPQVSCIFISSCCFGDRFHAGIQELKMSALSSKSNSMRLWVLLVLPLVESKQPICSCSVLGVAALCFDCS